MFPATKVLERVKLLSGGKNETYFLKVRYIVMSLFGCLTKEYTSTEHICSIQTLLKVVPGPIEEKKRRGAAVDRSRRRPLIERRSLACSSLDRTEQGHLLLAADRVQCTASNTLLARSRSMQFVRDQIIRAPGVCFYIQLSRGVWTESDFTGVKRAGE